MPREVLGDLLRALGQNPTQAEVAEIVAAAPREGAWPRPAAVLRGLTFGWGLGMGWGGAWVRV